MACAGLLLLSVLAAAAPDASNAVHSTRDSSVSPSLSQMPPSLSQQLPNRPINLSVPGAIHNSAITSLERNMEAASPSADRWSENGAPPAVSIGPLRAEFGGVTGRHMHLARVQLQGFGIFGGSVGASLDSRSARITLSWPTTPN